VVFESAIIALKINCHLKVFIFMASKLNKPAVTTTKKTNAGPVKMIVFISEFIFSVIVVIFFLKSSINSSPG